MTPLALLALGLAVAGGVYALDRLANSIVRPVPKLPARSVPDSGLEHEDIVIHGNGHELAAWLIGGGAATAGKPLLILANRRHVLAALTRAPYPRARGACIDSAA